MTGKEFYDNVVKYYGDYNYTQKNAIVAYLYEVRSKTKDLFEQYLDKLYQKLLRNYSNRYKTPPDIAELVKYHSEIMDELELETPKPLMIEENTEYISEELWEKARKRYPKIFMRKEKE